MIIVIWTYYEYLFRLSYVKHIYTIGVTATIRLQVLSELETSILASGGRSLTNFGIVIPDSHAIWESQNNLLERERDSNAIESQEIVNQMTLQLNEGQQVCITNVIYY